MKVLMFGWEFPPYISGGLGTACFGLTAAMTAHGVDVLFVLPHAQEWRPELAQAHFALMGADEVELPDVEASPAATEDGVCILEVDSPLTPYLTEAGYRQRVLMQTQQLRICGPGSHLPMGKVAAVELYGSDLLGEVSRYARVGRELGRTKEFDVIHAHDWMTYLAGIEARAASGKPLVCHVHATEYDRTLDEPNTKIVSVEKYGLTQADLVITVSHRTKEMLMRYYKIDPAKIEVVHNAVTKETHLERERVRKGLSEKIVLFLGRVTVQKGPDYFLEAARKVLEEVPNVRFVMAGSGDLLPRLVERVAEERLQDRFHFTGFLDRVGVEKMFSMTDIYVMPSISEPFGITPFEATLHHVPVIVSRQSGITEVLTHAVKVDFWDVHELADRIIELLRDEDLARRLADAGADELDQISWDRAARTVVQHYERLLEGDPA